MEFKDRLILAMQQKNIRPADLSRMTGIGEGAISQYRRGAYKATQRNLEKISQALGVSIPWLMGIEESTATHSELPTASNIMPMPKMKQVPLLGTIACGEPILAEENIEGMVDMPERVAADFALRCKGDSMINARIFDGDVVYIRQQPQVNDGEIAAVLVDDEATLKRVRLYPDHVSLEPENPQYRPLVYWGEDMAAVRIIGKAVAFTSTVR